MISKLALCLASHQKLPLDRVTALVTQNYSQLAAIHDLNIQLPLLIVLCQLSQQTYQAWILEVSTVVTRLLGD